MLPQASSAPSFEGGSDEAVVDLVGPGYEASVNLAFPAAFRAWNATLNVAGLAAGGDPTAYPENVTVTLDGTTLWQFRGTGFGPLGRQNLFSTGETQQEFRFGAGGGSRLANIRLPKDAVVQTATLSLKGSALTKDRDLANFTGEAVGDCLGGPVSGVGDFNGDGYDDLVAGACHKDGGRGAAYIFPGGPDLSDKKALALSGQGQNISWFGHSVSGAGDVNGDGYDDIIVGEPQSGAGHAYLFFGGKDPDSEADANLSGSADGDEFGYSVAGAGDVNGDGYDDVIVGAPRNSSAGRRENGRAYICFGGAAMDGGPDVNITGYGNYTMFGCSVSSAGNMNGDGFGDVIVGACRYDIIHLTNPAGWAFVYLGGAGMGGKIDAQFNGEAEGDGFGFSVSCAGDVDGNGCDDVIVGAPWSSAGGDSAGRAYIYLGYSSLDNFVDYTLTGAAAGDLFGTAVSGVGDQNDDGRDDVLVGAPGNDAGGANAGRGYLFFGEKGMDSVADSDYTGSAAGDSFGCSVSNAGDVEGDGYGEIAVGASLNDAGGNSAGRAYLFARANDSLGGVVDAGLATTTGNLWNRAGAFNGTAATVNFAGPLNNYLRAAVPAGTDGFGNSYADVPLNLTVRSGGEIALFNLSIIYRYDAPVPDFAATLNGYLSAHLGEQDAGGNISIPLKVGSTSPGKVRLSGLNPVRDLPPVQFRPIGDVELMEDASNTAMLDLSAYFRDDRDAILDYSVVSASNSSLIRVSINGGKYLSVDARAGASSDNWTGTVETVVACSDRWGQGTESNRFNITISNLNDPPVITSSPVLLAEPGVRYIYDVVALDGDGDALRFGLARSPAGMVIDPATGRIDWMPRAQGAHPVTVSVTDGNASGMQEFSITVPNRPPSIRSLPPLEAGVGDPYTYNMTAEDANLDVLAYSVLSGPAGMGVQAASGVLTWTPAATGDFDVSIMVRDALEAAFQNFTLKVLPGNRAPVIVRVAGPNGTHVKSSATLEFSVEAVDPDGDSLTYAWQENGTDIGTGPALSRKFAPGDHELTLAISDGRHHTTWSFDFTVDPSPSPPVKVASPFQGPAAAVAGAATAALVTIGIAIVIGTETGKFQLIAFFLPLYTRLQKEELLDNETRGLIRGCIISDPGIYYKEIARRLRLGNGAAVYHLRALEREGLIKSRSDGRLRRFYPAEMNLAEAPVSLNRMQQVIFDMLRERQGLSQLEIASHLEASYPTVHRHINRMAKMGVLRLERHGMTVKCYIANGRKVAGEESSVEDGNAG